VEETPELHVYVLLDGKEVTLTAPLLNPQVVFVKETAVIVGEGCTLTVTIAVLVQAAFAPVTV
jgi:hypothetical protein